MDAQPETAEAVSRHLIGVRLREPLQAEDYLVEEFDLRVGDFCVVETATGTTAGEVGRAKRPLPESGRDRVFPKVIRKATTSEANEWRERREREKRAIVTCQDRARQKNLRLKVVDVDIQADGRRVAVLFHAEGRVDFRELVRELAREFRARIEMRQIGSRDSTKAMDGMGPCGRRICCSAWLRKFEPISVKMAKVQDMPLTDNRLLGNCGRLKCCLLYEFATYDALRPHLPKVGRACQAECGGGCMQGVVRSVRVLKQTAVVGFQDGTEAEVPLSQLTWEGRPHVNPV